MNRNTIDTGYTKKSKNRARNNVYTYTRYYNWIKDLAISLFEWENLPEGCDGKYLERTLFENGQILFFYDENLKQYLNLPYTSSGKLDVYRYPIDRRAIGLGYTKDLTKSDSVIIYNNSIMLGDALNADFYAEKIWHIKTAIDVNIKIQKNPIIIKCPDNLVETVKSMYRKVEEGEHIIVGSGKLGDYTNIEILQTNVPFTADRMQEHYNQLMAEVCEYFGVNASREKKERMIISEVASANGMTEANRQIRMKPRKEACKQINEMFGLDIDVHFRTDVEMADTIMHNLASEYEQGYGMGEGEDYE